MRNARGLEGAHRLLSIVERRKTRPFEYSFFSLKDMVSVEFHVAVFDWFAACTYLATRSVTDTADSTWMLFQGNISDVLHKLLVHIYRINMRNCTAIGWWRREGIHHRNNILGDYYFVGLILWQRKIADVLQPKRTIPAHSEGQFFSGNIINQFQRFTSNSMAYD